MRKDGQRQHSVAKISQQQQFEWQHGVGHPTNHDFYHERGGGQTQDPDQMQPGAKSRIVILFCLSDWSSFPGARVRRVHSPREKAEKGNNRGLTG